jgi:hypothetical protein
MTYTAVVKQEGTEGGMRLREAEIHAIKSSFADRQRERRIIYARNRGEGLGGRRGHPYCTITRTLCIRWSSPMIDRIASECYRKYGPISDIFEPH